MSKFYKHSNNSHFYYLHLNCFFFLVLVKLKEMVGKRVMKWLCKVHGHSEEVDNVDLAKPKYSAPKLIIPA